MTVQWLWFSPMNTSFSIIGLTEASSRVETQESLCCLAESIDNGFPCLAIVLLKRLLVIDFSQTYDFCENIVMENSFFKRKNSFFKRKYFSALDCNKQEGTGQKGKVYTAIVLPKSTIFLIELSSCDLALIFCGLSRSPKPDLLTVFWTCIWGVPTKKFSGFQLPPI